MLVSGFEAGGGYLSAKYYYYLLWFSALFPLPIVRLQNNTGLIKEPLKYPNVNKLGNFGLSSVMVSESLALVLQHFCVGWWLPHLPVNLPAAGPDIRLAHTGDVSTLWTDLGC